MSIDIDSFARPRPVRIAFLVEDGPDAPAILDAIFRDCHGRWGGRFSLIVPCQDGRVIDAYTAWLSAFDPDLVYSYVQLGRDAVLDLKELLGALDYHAHPLPTERRSDLNFYRPDYRFRALSSLSTVFRQTRHAADEGPRAMLHNGGWAPTRFQTDNFGDFDTGYGGFVIPTDARQAVSARSLVDRGSTSGRQAEVATSDPRALDVAALRLIAGGETTSMASASLRYAPKLEFASEWGRSMTVVVGDAFADRIVFWNARLHLPAWLDTDVHSLRVDDDQLDDDAFLIPFMDFLRLRNRVSDGSGGQTRISFRSTSLSEERLQTRVREILHLSPTLAIHAKPSSLVEVVPTAAALKSAREGNSFGTGWDARPDWVKFDGQGPIIRPPAIQPDHLAHAPPNQSFCTGYWAVDLQLPSELEFGLVRQNRWHLPLRWPVAGRFDVKYVPGGRMEINPAPRATRTGCLATFVSSDRPLQSVGVPRMEAAIRRSLLDRHFGNREDVSKGWIRPRIAAQDASSSNEARYLDGVLGLFGGLESAARVLLHPFLKSVFSSLGGRPTVEATNTGALKRLIQFRRTRDLFDLHDDDDVGVLADLVTRAARGTKGGDRYLAYSTLKKRWVDYRAAYWRDHAIPSEGGNDDVNWDEREARSLEDWLIRMRERKILFQGHEWLCETCHHRNWVGLEGLSARWACEVCNEVKPAPVEVAWQFRANPFLIESLRDTSVLSLVWCLNRLTHRAEHSFAYAGPTILEFGDTDQRPKVEADLLVLLDGQTVVCEVKSSWRHVKASDIKDIVGLAKRLRPNLAIFAVMEGSARHADELEAAEMQLAAVGIDFELVTGSDTDWDHSPMLSGI